MIYNLKRLKLSNNYLKLSKLNNFYGREDYKRRAYIYARIIYHSGNTAHDKKKLFQDRDLNDNKLFGHKRGWENV